MMPRRALASLVLAASVGACVFDNKSFDPAGATTGEPGTSLASASVGTTSGTSSTTSSGGSGSGSATTGEGTTVAVTTGGETTAAEATSTSASTEDTSSGGPLVIPGTYEFPATVAACVLLDNGSGHGPPSVCGGNADLQNDTALTGLMQIDTEVKMLDGMNRRAEAFLRFDVPEQYAGLVVADAILHVQVADGRGILANGPQSGVLVTTEPFVEADLDTAAPAMGMKLYDDLGPVATNESITWSIPVELVNAGSPLFLGLLPIDTDGIFYRGRDTPGAPTLEIVLVSP